MYKSIIVRGASENNLKNISINIPINKISVITGLSGSGKSSLAIDTISAEGQRRYIETFSSYARQFLDRIDKPNVESLEGLLPSIAIQQVNPVKTSRSTVGTMTELSDHLKILFSKASDLFCKNCGIKISPDDLDDIAETVKTQMQGKKIGISFSLDKPKSLSEIDFKNWLSSQGYTKLLYSTGNRVKVLVGRFKITNSTKISELHDIFSQANKAGKNHFEILELDTEKVIRKCTTNFSCTTCKTNFKYPRPALFSFNSPIGACDECKGFGKVIGLDIDLVIPDKSLSIEEGVIKPFNSAAYRKYKSELIKFATDENIPIHLPWSKLHQKDKIWIINGGSNSKSATKRRTWIGLTNIFKKIEKKSYKMHVRVFLSRYRSYENCEKCNGKRLKQEPLNWKINEMDIHDWSCLEIDEINREIKKLEKCMTFENLSQGKKKAVGLISTEIKSRIKYLQEVGLGYLTLDRQSRTLSGGEVQRINLTTALGSSLTNTLFILDEPSIGLHHKDLVNLITVIKRLKSMGNTILIVEHDSLLISESDNIIEIGPEAGEKGGSISFEGTYKQLIRSSCITGKYLRKNNLLEEKENKAPLKNKFVEIRGIESNNLNNINITFPIRMLTAITGVSGSGKSSLVQNIIFPAIAKNLGMQQVLNGKIKSISGENYFSNIIYANQKSVTKNARSNPALYTGVFSLIRDIFGKLEESKINNYTSSHFSFNSTLGQCPSCQGHGVEKIELQFLSDLSLQCPLCKGTKYKKDVVSIRYNEKSIVDVLNLSVSQAKTFFSEKQNVIKKLEPLIDVGLGYLKLGQSLSTLSGGELQRLKIADHLLSGEKISSKSNKKTLFIFDEPTTGLHLADVKNLLIALRKLTESGHTVIVIEHCLEFINNSDWIIELGPGAGKKGGNVLAQMPPKNLKTTNTNTGLALASTSSRKTPKLENSIAKSAEISSELIQVQNASENNLQNVSVDIPLNKLTLITGVSGSGKSTLAFDIIFSEGRRRYLDSLNAYAKQFIQPASKPSFDRIINIPPTVAVEQRTTQGGFKSTVGTLTEISHFLRVLFVAIGKQYCPNCNVPVDVKNSKEIFDTICRSWKGQTIRIFAPLVKKRKGTYKDIAKWAESRKYKFLKIDSILHSVKKFPELERYKEHSIELLVSELKITDDKKLLIEEKIQEGLLIGKGQIEIEELTIRKLKKDSFTVGENKLFSLNRTCPKCETAFDELDPRMFSFNSKIGWCNICLGSGFEYNVKDFPENENDGFSFHRDSIDIELFELVNCKKCNGSRLNDISSAVRIGNETITDLSNKHLMELEKWIDSVPQLLTQRELLISKFVTEELKSRLAFIKKVGLDYLSLNRSAPTLSGGELQRIKLAAQLGSNLNGVCYVLDEPTIGLHPQDNDVLLKAIDELKKRGNTVIIIEHDPDTIKKADYIIDMGPGAGELGGKIIAKGSLKEIKKNERSITGKYLRKKKQKSLSCLNHPSEFFEIRDANLNNLKNIDVRFAHNCINVITGVSGSGKSSLVKGVLVHNLKKIINNYFSRERKKIHSFYKCSDIKGWENFDKLLEVDQNPIGRTPRSTPATYLNIWDSVRKIFSETNSAKEKGWKASYFSFNSGEGRCETCKGLGKENIKMNFLPNVAIKCESCDGFRFSGETLSILWQGMNIAEVLNMSIDTACVFFKNHRKIYSALSLMSQFGLGYLRLGQASSTLSGGEAQRLKLIAELQKDKESERTLYVFDEPTVGLHMSDVTNLLNIFKTLIKNGNTIIVIEHNADVWIKSDWVIELGPSGGNNGGFLLSQCAPSELIKQKTPTGDVLKKCVL